MAKLIKRDIKKKTLAMEDELPFGEYKGEQVEDIVSDDPEYILFMTESEAMEFEEEIIEIASRLA